MIDELLNQILERQEEQIKILQTIASNLEGKQLINQPGTGGSVTNSPKNISGQHKNILFKV